MTSVLPLGDVLLGRTTREKLQQGWSPQCESRPADGDQEWAVLKTTAVQAGTFLPDENKKLPTSLTPRPGLEVQPGDLLLTCAGPRARCGVATLVRSTRPKLMISGKMYRFRTDPEVVEPAFLSLFLLSPAAQRRIDLMKTGISESGLNLTKDRFLRLPVPVVALDEQRRIVDILEDHLSRLDAAQGYLRASQRRSESLTSSWFRGSGLMSAPCSTLSQLLRSPLANGRSVLTRDGGFPVLRLTALADYRVRLSERKGGAWDEVTARPFLVERGDVLVSRGNGSLRLVARGALVAEDPDPVAFPDTMIRVRPRPEMISPEYLVLVWNSRLVRQQIEAIARTTAGIYKVNQRQLGQIELPVVPIDVQQRLLRDADELDVERRRMVDAVERAGARTEALRRALLGAAFAGRLTGRSSDTDRVEELAGV